MSHCGYHSASGPRGCSLAPLPLPSHRPHTWTEAPAPPSCGSRAAHTSAGTGTAACHAAAPLRSRQVAGVRARARRVSITAGEIGLDFASSIGGARTANDKPWHGQMPGMTSLVRVVLILMGILLSHIYLPSLISRLFERMRRKTAYGFNA